MSQAKSHLNRLFEQYPREVQKILADVLCLEQQYITDTLHPNSQVYKELRDKIDEVIEEAVTS